MGKATRSMKRTFYKRNRKNAEKELAAKINMFDRLPNECLVCQKNFDKKDKQMVSEWYVIVKEEENVVRLYCPECWEKATNTVRELKERISERDK